MAVSISKSTVSTIGLTNIAESDLIPSKEEAIKSLFTQMKLTSSSEAHLRNEIYKFDKGHHTFQLENRLVYVARQSSADPISTGFFSIEKKSYFARGGEGKIYAIQESDQSLVLKLSRKLLKIVDDQGDKIPSSIFINSRTLLGEFATDSILNERFVVNEITKYCKSSVGLNVEILAEASFNTQLGYVGKAFSCDLLNLVKQRNLTIEERVDIMRQMFEGLENLHSIGFRHRDLKFDNILINPKDSGYEVVIGDFGNTRKTSHFFPEGCSLPTIEMLMEGTTQKYSPLMNWLSIQAVLAGMSAVSQDSAAYKRSIAEIDRFLVANDQFSLGVICYILLTSQCPDFSSFYEGTYFDFDLDWTLTDKSLMLTQMYEALYQATAEVSHRNYQGKSYYIAKKIHGLISDGLSI